MGKKSHLTNFYIINMHNLISPSSIPITFLSALNKSHINVSPPCINNTTYNLIHPPYLIHPKVLIPNPIGPLEGP